MTMLAWLWVSLLIASAYWFAQIFYNLRTSGRSLFSAISKTREALDSLAEIQIPEVPKLGPNKPDQKLQLIVQRRQQQRRRMRAKEERRRRLVTRLEKMMNESGRTK